MRMLASKQTLALAALGASYMFAKNLSLRRVDPTMASYGIEGDLGVSLSEFVSVVPPSDLEAILGRVRSLHEMTASKNPSVQWRIASGVQEVSEMLSDACRAGGISPTAPDERLRHILYCKDDVIPDVVGHLDNLMHNYLMDIRR